MSERPFRIHGLQQVAIGGPDKHRLRTLSVDMLGHETNSTNVSERETEVVAGVTRFAISTALTDVFLPHRKAVFESYLNDRPKNAKSAHKNAGGAGTH